MLGSRRTGRQGETGGPGRAAAGAGTAGRVFAAVTAAPPLLISAWLLPGLPLLLAGRFLPGPMLVIWAALAVPALLLTWWQAPGRWPATAAGGRAPAWAVWWGLAGTVAVAAAFGAWQLLMDSPQVFVLRSPGATLQAGYWIARHGALPVPTLPTAFGGIHPGLTFSSFGFAGHGGAVVPQVVPGLPMVVSAGLWAHGVPGAAAVSPILGALAVLTVGGLTGRLAGPPWAPAGALLLALTLPEAYTSRSGFSETLAQALLIGGLSLVVDSLGSRPAPALAGCGGLCLGLASLAETGMLVVAVPVLAFGGAALAGRRPQALPFAGGMLVGVAYGLAGTFAVAGPAGGAASPLRPAVLAAAVFAGMTAVGVVTGVAGPLRRRVARWLAARPLRWLPEAGAVVVVAAAAAFAVRPYLQTVRGPGSPYVASLQRLAGLAVAPGRSYAEDSLYWVIWYLGVPALLLGVAGLAMLTRRCLRGLLTWRDPSGSARAWALPLMIFGWGAVTVLWLPGTVPDQPWAGRRLVPVLLPGLAVCAVWGAAWLTGRARERGAGLAAASAVVTCGVAALLVPAVVTTFGIGVKPAGGPAGARLAFQRTGMGESGAVGRLCAALPHGSSVVLVDRASAREFTQVVRGMCGVPAAVMAGASPAQVRGVVSAIEQAGRRPVLLATRQRELTGYAPAHQVLDLATAQDAHVLTQPPVSTWPARYLLWLAVPGRGAATGGA